MNIEKLKCYMPNRIFNQRVRAAAVKRVRKDLILHGKSEYDISEEDLEYLLEEAESDIKNELQKGGLISVVLLLGLGL